MHKGPKATYLAMNMNVLLIETPKVQYEEAFRMPAPSISIFAFLELIPWNRHNLNDFSLWEGVIFFQLGGR